jgi:poly(A) polymerase
VRIIRVVRFAAKLGFAIDPATRKPIQDMAPLLANVPASRLFDEMIKLLQTGHALKSLDELRKQGLQRGVFPILDALLVQGERGGGHFVQLALADTDRRVGEGRAVAPSFMLACLLWHDVQERWQQLREAGEAPFPALQQAVDAVFEARIGDISGRGKLAADMREIWLMQPRFERRSGSSPHALVEQPRFRAGYDFLRLRADAGEIDAALAEWWEDFSLGSDDERVALLLAAKEAVATQRADTPPESRAEDAAPKKRRRRRRRSGAGDGATTPEALAEDGDGPQPGDGPQDGDDPSAAAAPARPARRQ